MDNYDCKQVKDEIIEAASKPSLSGKARRAKGADGEREFFHLLSDRLGEQVRRALGAARDGGADSEQAGILNEWAVEVKRQESPKILTWWNQSLSNALHRGCIPALAYRLTRRPWRVIVPIEALDPENRHLVTWEMTLDWTAEISIDGFSYIVRERYSPK